MAVEVRMPKLTQTMSRGMVVRWLKKEGEEVKKGQPLLEIETDKATMEIEAEASGFLLQILVNEGELVEVNALLAIIGELKEKGKLVEHTGPPLTSKKPVSPAARRQAEKQHIDINSVLGTGPDGLITEDDVLKYAEQQQAKLGQQRSVYGEEQMVPLTGTRKAMADRVTMSHQILAKTTTFAEVDMNELIELRKKIQIPVTTWVVKAAILALREFPLINSILVDNKIIIKKYINMGVAVSTDDGLVVPVIHNAEENTLGEIAKKIKQLAEKARIGRLSLADISDGTFTVTNSGVFGSLFFAPVINYPESAVIGMGKIMKTPVVRDDQIVIRPMMYMSLSYDHRIIDGALAVTFLQKVKEGLEMPDTLTS